MPLTLQAQQVRWLEILPRASWPIFMQDIALSIRELAERGNGKHLHGRKCYRNSGHQVQPICGAWNHNLKSPKPWLVITMEYALEKTAGTMKKGN